MANVASETFTSTSAPIQYAAVRAFRGGSQIEQYLVQSRRILRALGQHAADALNAAGIDVNPPEGAFYLFPDFTAGAGRLAERGIHNNRELCEQLLQDTGVAILPGSDFGRPNNELTARLAYVDFDGARVLAAAELRSLDEPLDKQFLNTFCGNVVRAIDLMCEWFKA
jgi:aspartate aminotransferase